LQSNANLRAARCANRSFVTPPNASSSLTTATHTTLPSCVMGCCSVTGRQHLGGGALVAALAGMLGAGVAAVHVQPLEELILMRVFGAIVAKSIACAMRADTRRMLQFPPVCASFMEALQVRIDG
jgi:hypothetical protein